MAERESNSRRALALAAIMLVGVVAAVLSPLVGVAELSPEVFWRLRLPRHAAIDADVLAVDEARLIRGEEEHHAGDVHGVADASGEMLAGVRAAMAPSLRVNPARRDRVDSHPSRPRLAASACVSAAIPPFAAV